ncbi:3-hydroxyisobutyryl-CoA hydrolase 1 [Linum grandiflorum]
MAFQDSIQTDQVLVEEKSSVRTLVLNRPKQLNALSFQMVSRLLEFFLAYEADPNVKLIILKGKGRAFCAGGDVAAVVHDIQKGTWKAGAKFFAQEFSLNYLIATYSKPQVSILNGIVMGGGNGASMHGKFRVATETSVIYFRYRAFGWLQLECSSLDD